VYDVTDPTQPSLLFLRHLSPASEAKSPDVAYEDGTLGDIDPESSRFLSAADSPRGNAGVMFAGAWSGTISFYEFTCGGATPAPCGDDDATLIALAGGAGYTVGGCADVKAFCEHEAYGSVVQATCPVTCGLCTPCADDDAEAVSLASGHGITISGCAAVMSFCNHGTYGSVVQATCPATCGSCSRRLADAKGTNADERPSQEWAVGAVQRIRR
jgi:hypothetical protein